MGILAYLFTNIAVAIFVVIGLLSDFQALIFGYGLRFPISLLTTWALQFVLIPSYLILAIVNKQEIPVLA